MIWVMIRWWLLLVAPTLAGCRSECAGFTRWDELDVEVSDERSEAQLGVQEVARLALAQFAAWSGEEEVCVTSMTVVPAEEAEGFEGLYDPNTAEILLAEQALDPWEATFHELCHAVDFVQGLSLANPDLFPQYMVTQIEEYPTGRARTREAFARICEQGARDVGRWRVWEEDCGIDYTDDDLDAMELVQDSIFPNAERIPWDDPGFGLEVGTPWTLTQDGTEWSLVELAATKDALVALYTGTEWSSRVRFMDPLDGAVLGQYEIDLCPGADNLCPVSLISGDGEVWVLSGTEGDGWLWRLSAEGAEAVEHPCPEILGDVVAGGVLWDGRVGRYDTLGLAGCDLSTGEILTPPEPEPSFAPRSQYVDEPCVTTTRVGSRPAAWWESTGMAWLQEDGQTWRDATLPWHLALFDLAPLPDGSWLFLVQAESPKTDDNTFTMALFDPSTNTFFAPDDACPLPLQPWDTYFQELFAGDGWAVVAETYITDLPELTLTPFLLSTPSGQ